MKNLNEIFDIIEKNTRWIYSKLGKDIVITSRIRLARNIKGYPFPYNMTNEESKEIERLLIDIFLKMSFSNIFIIDVPSLNELEKQILIERHLISKEFSENGAYSKVIIIPEKKLTVMINEEDHLRIQVIYPGLNLKKCWKIANEIDNYIDEKVEYAFSPNFGFLTACPTNIGTGLKASVLINIPGIKFLKKEKIIFNIIEKIGITIRGFYGEGSLPFGSIYQLSSSESTGKTEEEIIKEIESVVKLIKKEEMNSIEEIKRDKKLRNKIYKIIEKNSEDKSQDPSKLYSIISLAYNLGMLKIKKKEFEKLLFSFLNGYKKIKRDFNFYKKEGKILKRKIWETINV
jgi:protein arginine kinase